MTNRQQQRRHQRRAHQRRQAKARRGAVMIVVLSLLVLFTLIGITFVVIATRYKDAAESAGQVELKGTDPEHELDMAAYQVLRGTSLTSLSSLRGHGLLRDRYGNSVKGQLTADATKAAQGELIVFQCQFEGGKPSPYDDHLAGNIITMISGNARGISSYITRYEAAPWGEDPVSSTQPARLVVEAFRSDTNKIITPTNGDLFIVNGKPFDGTGIGYKLENNEESLNETVDVAGTQREVALLPHFRAYNSAGVNHEFADESYDAADYQNLPLAFVIPDPQQSSHIIPSFHRPALINYWRNRVSDFDPAGKDRRLMQSICLRPLPWDHPQFSGSNLELDPSRDKAVLLEALVDGSWDVDNNGDGIPDGIWVDLGMPAQTSKEGRKYKALFSFHVQDMGGRLNLNTHGALWQTDSSLVNWGTNQYYYAGMMPPSSSFNSNPRFYTQSNRITLPQGRGVGPAEINLIDLFGNASDYRNFMQRRYQHPRYFNEQLPGAATSNDFITQFGTFYIPAELEFDPSIIPPLRSLYLTPPDRLGRSTVAIDHSGRPVFGLAGRTGGTATEPPYEIDTNETVDDPYEIDLVTPNGTDLPYEAANLERLLRHYDVDVQMLPKRFDEFADVFFDDPDVAAINRGIVTTHSFSTDTPRWTPRYGSIVDLVAARMRENGVTDEKEIREQLRLLLPFEIRKGGKLDLNRLWSSTIDQNSNGVVGESLEVNSNYRLPAPFLRDQTDSASGVKADLTNGEAARLTGGTPQEQNQAAALESQRFARQMFARHLFVIMLAILEENHELQFYDSNTPEKKELTIRRLAQWCVNVVDFRDADAIMTPFEYDKNPFNGWSVDGYVGGGSLDDDSSSPANSERGFVWGVEYPDLLLTESLNFHARRVKDLKEDNGEGDKREEKDDDDNPKDEDLDQYRIPQGTTVFELYATRHSASLHSDQSTGNQSQSNRHLPLDLYDVNGNLILDKLAPPSSVAGAQKRFPVWRIAISEPHKGGSSESNVASPLTRRDNQRDSVSFEPEDLSLLNSNSDSLSIERQIWFTTNDPTAIGFTQAEASSIFYNRVGDNRLAPGNYLLIAPRLNTAVGSISNAGANMDPRSPQKFDIDPRAPSLSITNTAATEQFPNGEVPLPAMFLAGANRPTNWEDDPNNGSWIPFIGMNISEPLPANTGYYPEPAFEVEGIPADGMRTFKDAYANPMAEADSKYLDEPLDSKDDISSPLKENDMFATRTYEDFRTAFLQRLANPLQAYNPAPGESGHDDSRLANPYITIDWMPLDLTVYNGEDEKPNNWDDDYPGHKFDTDSQDEPGDLSQTYFRTRRRGDNAQSLGNDAANLWRQDWTTPLRNSSNGNNSTNTTNGPASLYFRPNMESSLGYLNATLSDFYGANTKTPLAATPAWAGSPVSGGGGGGATPKETFPWLTWNDRPFSTPHEILLVPASSQSRLMHEYNRQFDPQGIDPYGQPNNSVAEYYGYYPHLLNFFNSNGQVPANSSDAANLFRIFEYVGIPSPFAGTSKWYSAKDFNVEQNDYLPANSPNIDPLDRYRAPFNKLSRFRDPGKINWNTISHEKVWNAFTKLHQSTYLNADWQKIVNNRRGYDVSAPTTPYGILDMNDQFPTRFANPLRASTEASLVPLDTLRRADVDVTLFRSDAVNQSDSPSDKPLLNNQAETPNTHTNVKRNPYFQYQALMRSPSLTTNHSNVYAVWITVGYFEVSEWTNAAGNQVFDAAHPDGFQLGQEVGSLSGEIKRHRAFYLIDRSIPVGFEPGENHNVDRAILIRRFIE